jgi:hypothetical protein
MPLAFNYDELKVYREDIIQHVIPLKEEINPFRQKLRKLNPKLAPLVQQELQKMLEENIIAQTRHWLIGKLIEIYHDDLTVFSKVEKTHINHLRQVLDRCREFGISLLSQSLG